MLVEPLSNILVPIVLLGSVVGLIWGITTSGQSYPDAKLNREFEMETATPARRLGGSLLDGVLVPLTLIIGWFIWFAIVAPRGQTPGKTLVSTYVIRDDGTRAGAGFMWGREILVKRVLFFITGLFLAGLARLVASLWCLWDADKQCGWDKIMNSYVAFAPYGEPVPGEGVASIGRSGPAERLRELQQLREDGIITAEEYEERRQRLVEHL
jgi:uncharacterized RDD family membrane protein YckC